MSRLAVFRVSAALCLVAPAPALAEVVKVEVTRRVDVLGGRSFGAAGAYEWLEGRILFAFDPANRANARIVDLGLAPRNPDGKVEAWADFAVLRPKTPLPDGVALVEVSNRGLKLGLQFLDYATGALHPTAEADFGDGLLMRLGLTVIWVGWQHDVPLDPDLIRLHAPVATGPGGEELSGLLRADWVVPRPAKSLSIAHANHVAYPADTSAVENQLTVRDGRYAERTVVPRSAWRFAREEAGRVVPDPTRLYLASGFEPGRIYELVYRSRNPRVAGLGLAVIRDVISYARHDPSALFPVRYGIVYGISQSGRFLRHFLYQGFNTDEAGRPAYDGVMVHVAGGGRGSFNHRFAQPSRDAHRYDTFFYPTDVYPFSSATQTDPITGLRDGLFAHQLVETNLPKVFQTNSGYEYWGRAASLIHTTVDGSADLAPHPNERIYLLAGAQHAPGSFPPPQAARHPGSRAYRGNPVDYVAPMRALLVRMIEWVRDGVTPPPSAYPQLADGTLVPLERYRFPTISDLAAPTVVHQADRLDFGPDWPRGLITNQPPKLGEPYPALVPQVDSLGNELGGVRTVELEVPLASYPTWNLRVGLPGDTRELTRILGSYLPLPRTEAERKAARDPRPSIASLYPSREAFLARARSVAERLVRERVLLADDVDRVVGRAAAQWDWVMTR
ncbi:MAG: alpha/beta hydrolase domain-containing protein [Gemmatimonadales bacterium]